MTPQTKRTEHRTHVRSALLAFTCALLGVAGVASGATPGPESPRPRTPEVIKRQVVFQVANVNGSSLPCPSDGAPYEVKGHLVGPTSQLGPDASGQPPAVTLYLHGLSFGEFFWSFSAVPRYDYAAAMARAGHVSVVVDRLGYGASGHSDGKQTCLGAQADVAHQIVTRLRSGDYVADPGPSIRFQRVALAGHAVGALIANLEAYSFNDVDGLLAMSYTPQVRLRAMEHFYAGQVVCDAGGEPSQPGGPGGYAYFGQTDVDFRANVFHNAAPAVKAAATRLRARDPCADSRSIIDALVQELASLPRVSAPVLLVCGREDALTPAFACPYLKKRYVGSKDVSLKFVSNAGNALPLERTAPAFRRKVSAWLKARGF